MTDDPRLIEDYLPIEAISAEASREKSVRKGHISTLHLWWARRPLVACRAAVYGALVPASRFVPEGAGDGKKKSLGRANAARFVERLCKYPGDPKAIAEAQRHVLEAHAERLSRETGQPVTVEDIEAGRAPRPKVLDMFAGGGAIPLEALRLGCEAYALDLNPVAHIIELCTLVYPQKYGKPDPAVRGMTGPPAPLSPRGRGVGGEGGIQPGEPTWGGLAAEVRWWGEWVLKKVKAEIGDLYPPIPDPAFKGKRKPAQRSFAEEGEGVPPGYLMPVAYLWTRTVTCKNPACRATVPLVKQTWLCKKKDQYVALKVVPLKGKKRVRFDVVECRTEKGLGFDPEAGSKGGNATCPFCGTVADSTYVKAEGHAGRLGFQPMAIASAGSNRTGKSYFSADDLPGLVPVGATIRERIDALCKTTGLTVPAGPIINDAKGALFCVLYGLKTWGDVFSPRQTLCLLTFAAAVRRAESEMRTAGLDEDRVKAVVTFLGAMVDKLADFNSVQCTWNFTGGRGVKNSFSRQTLAMTWDSAETNPFNDDAASWPKITEDIPAAIEMLSMEGTTAPVVQRGSAIRAPWPDSSLDAVVTDPPYYDNVPYADISDFFYVWLKRTVGHLYPEHFANEGTPKKTEAVADAVRHEGNRQAANAAYEAMMAQAFGEADRMLKSSGSLIVVYAHKTTLGWATLVEALRRAGFIVTEAWPLDTERKGRVRAMDSAALASSIFLIGRKREGETTGSYETDVRPDLEAIVRERVETLWEQGISGADLVIACVGAGLRAFTRFARVEYANGEEVPAERFLTEVETVVLDSILGRLSKEVGGNGGRTSLAGVDPATRFYILWRYTYRGAELDAGEVIVFANGTHVELDGPSGLSSGARALVEKKKGKYRLLDFAERGEDDHLGLPADSGQAAPLVDVLHRVLWLMENRPRELAAFLREAGPNREQLRLAAQALAGPALKGGELADVSPTGELAALAKLTANWRGVIEENVFSPGEQSDRKKGQRRLFE
jgi:putative DNA methylase